MITSIQPRRIAVLAPPGAEILDVTGPLGTFSAANRVLRREFGHEAPAYSLLTIGPAAGPVDFADGVHIIADRSWTRLSDDIDTLVIPGAADLAPMFDPLLLQWLGQMSTRVHRLVSVCTGAIVLAEAGLLAGHKATTHWESCSRLASYPDIEVLPDSIYVHDENIWTSAGITAGIDLALALIEEDHNRAVAQATARELVVFLRRPGGQAQFSAHLMAQDKSGDELDELLEWILEHLNEDLSVEMLADRACMTSRHLSRLFTSRRGVTPAAFVEMARVDAARRMLERPGISLKEVARTTGFGSVERLRRACVRRIGVLPSEYKRRNVHAHTV